MRLSRGKSYLQIGSVTMGIGGSIMDQNFMEEYLGLRVEEIMEITKEAMRHMAKKNLELYYAGNWRRTPLLA